MSITEPSFTLVNSSILAITCAGQSDGGIFLTVVGGTAPHTFQWNTGATTSFILQLGQGTYAVTITDAAGCDETWQVFLNEPSPLSVSATSTNINCLGSGSATAQSSVTGGTPPYTYLWSNGSTSASLAGLSAGIYSVSVTDFYLCTATASTQVLQDAGLTIQVQSNNVSCFGLGNGSASVLVLQGNAPYTYQWSNGAQTQAISNLGPGTYGVTVTDSVGCTQSASAVISQPGTLNIGFSTVQVSCFGGNDGAATATPSGGTPPFSYLWSNGLTTSTISGIPSANYTVEVTDSSGCTAIAQVTIIQPFEMIVSGIVNHVDCYGDSTGYIVASTVGGTSPYFYQWSNGYALPNPNALTAGTYYVTVTDSEGCSVVDTFVINQPLTAIQFTLSGNNPTCFGALNGSITTTVSGGAPPYQFAWTGGAAGQNPINLGAGTYTVVISDFNGCTATGSYTLVQPSQIQIDTLISPVLCNGNSNGSITAIPSGGNAPYSYLWSTGATVPTISGLPGGSYNVIVTDAGACSSSLIITLFQPAPFSVSVVAMTSTQATATPSGGVQPYTFLWNNGANTSTIVVSQNGLYTVVVTDANGCTATGSVFMFPDDLEENDALQINVFPNPSSAWFHVQVLGGVEINMNVSVYDVRGATVYRSEHRLDASGELAIDARQWSSGVYFLELSSAERRYFFKVVKQE